MNSPFTDGDLARWKAYYEDPKRGNTPLKWKALLARLEAAELILENGVSLAHFEDCDKMEHSDLACTCGSEERWYAWLRSKTSGEAGVT